MGKIRRRRALSWRTGLLLVFLAPVLAFGGYHAAHLPIKDPHNLREVTGVCAGVDEYSSVRSHVDRWKVILENGEIYISAPRYFCVEFEELRGCVGKTVTVLSYGIGPVGLSDGERVYMAVDEVWQIHLESLLIGLGVLCGILLLWWLARRGVFGRLFSIALKRYRDGRGGTAREKEKEPAPPSRKKQKNRKRRAKEERRRRERKEGPAEKENDLSKGQTEEKTENM